MKGSCFDDSFGDVLSRPAFVDCPIAQQLDRFIALARAAGLN